MIFTGGDDNALGVTILSVSDNHVGSQTAPDIRRDSLLVPRAHAAAIRALLVLPHPTGTAEDQHGLPLKWRILTASNNQQVKIWDIVLTRPQELPSVDALDVRKVRGGFWTGVADVADAGLINCVCGDTVQQEPAEQRATVAICGVGIDVREVPLS